MTLRQLEIFIVTASLLNLKEAARKLHIAQSAISHHLRVLQEEFGTRFHRKNGTGIELTPAGALFLREAKAIISQIEHLKATLGSEAAELNEPALTVGGCDSASNDVLPSLLSRFKKQYPDVQINLQSGGRSDLEGLIVRGEMDLALVHGLSTTRKLASELFDTDHVIAFVRLNHPLAGNKHLDWADLERFGFVIPGPNIGQRFIKRYRLQLQKYGVKFKVIMQCDTPDGVKTAVVRTDGIGILFLGNVSEEIKHGRIKKIEFPDRGLLIKRYIIYPKAKPLTPQARAFLKLLRAYRSK